MDGSAAPARPANSRVDEIAERSSTAVGAVYAPHANEDDASTDRVALS
jgi:hypothetical protein